MPRGTSIIDGRKLHEIILDEGEYKIKNGRRWVAIEPPHALGKPIPAVIIDGVDKLDDLATEGAREQGLLKKYLLGRPNGFMATKMKLHRHPHVYDTAVAITLYHAEPRRYYERLDDE